MKRPAFFTIVLTTAALVLASFAAADVPPIINYQGFLTKPVGQNDVPVNQPQDFRFSIYDAETGGDKKWGDEVHECVTVNKGVFSVWLGDAVVSPIPLSESNFVGPNRWLQIEVRPCGDVDYEVIDPRARLVTVPYAFRVATVDSATGGTIKGDVEIKDGKLGIGIAIPTEKLHVLDGGLRLENSSFQLQYGSLVAGHVLTSDATGVGTWQSPATVSDGDWNLSPPNMASAVSGNVGIGINLPTAKLHVKDHVMGLNGAATRINFRATNLETAATGLDVNSTTLVRKGSQIGVNAHTSMDASNHPQKGEALGRLAFVNGYDSRGNVMGVWGDATPNVLHNYGVGNTSHGLGGRFRAIPATSLSLNSNGTYWVGGVLGEIGNAINGTPASGAVSAVIGIDNNTGSAYSYAGYFDGKGYFSGNLGIGTTSPAFMLDVNGDGRMYDSLEVRSSGYSGRWYRITSKARQEIRCVNDLVTYPGYNFAVVHANGNFLVGPVEGAYTLIVNGSTQNVGIGIDNPSEKLHVIGNICATGTIGVCSDGRYKKEVSTLAHPLQTIAKLRGVDFTWRTEEFPEKEFSNKPQVGFIAQEIKDILPGAVSKGADGYYSVDYGRLTPVLVEAIKELRQQNEDLKRRIEQLESQ